MSRPLAIALLLVAAGACAQSPVPTPEPTPAPAKKEKKPPAPLGFTWWNDVPELVRRGNSAYAEKSFEDAEDSYRDAQLRAPNEAVAAFNLGLSLARQGKLDEATSSFERSANQATEDTGLRSEALYNKGRAHVEAAMKAMEDKKKPNRARAIAEALSALDSFDRSLDSPKPFAGAQESKEQVQHFLASMATPPPPKSQSQQQQQQDGEGGEGEDQQPQQPQDGDQQQQQPGDQAQQQGDQGDQQQQQQQPQQGAGQATPTPAPPQDGQGEQPEDAKEEEGQQGEPQEGQELTEQQAREMLNLLGDPQNIVLRKNAKNRLRPDPEKDW